MSLKVKVGNIVALFYVLFALWTLNPYFTWTSFHGGMLGYVNGSVPVRSLFALISGIVGLYYMAITHKTGKLTEMSVVIILNAVVLLGICGGIGSNLFDFTWISYISIAIFLFLPLDLQSRTFEMFLSVFVITLIPSLIFYLMDLIGLHLPYSVLPPYETIKLNAGIYYQHRILSAQLINPIAIINRFNGIYFEAGILGTIAAMLLGIKKYDFIGKGKWREKILLISGIFSMSLAFILLSIIYFISKNLLAGKLKNTAILVCIVAIYFTFISIQFTNPVLENIQNRITIVDYSLQGDNRVSKGYERVMDRFYDSPPITTLIGNGKGSFGKIQGEMNFDGSSYKSILYDYGYLGFIMYVGWFIMYGIKAMRKLKLEFSSILPVVIMQLANIYQNPAVFPIYFVVIFAGGIAELSQEAENNVRNI